MKRKVVFYGLITIFILSLLSFNVLSVETQRIYNLNRNCQNINAVGLSSACRCVLNTAKEGLNYCSQNPNMPPCSVAGDVKGVCQFITGMDATSWTVSFLDRALTIFGIRDEFFKVLNFIANGANQLNDNFNINENWKNFFDYYNELKNDFNNKNQESRFYDLGCNRDVNYFNCVAQNKMDPYCGYINGKPRNENDECYVKQINCNEISKDFPQDCIINQRFTCMRVGFNLYKCLSPKYDYELCQENCGNTNNCKVVGYKETESCKRNNDLYDLNLNKLTLSEKYGCESIIELDLSIKEGDSSYIYNPNDPNQKTNGYCVQKTWESIMGYCTGDNKCYPLCYKTQYNLCCPQKNEKNEWTGNGIWVKENDCSCPGIIQICERICELQPIYQCESPQTNQNTQNNQKTNTGSCPYVYSIDDKGNEILEEDLLVLKYSENNDYYYTNLNNYFESIVIKEHLNERTYLDNIKLLKSDKNSYISNKGNVVSIKNPEKVLCETKEGEDCTNIISRKDAGYFSPSIDVDKLRIIKSTDYNVKAYSTNIEKIKQNYNNFNDDKFDYLILTLPKKQENAKLIISASMTDKIGVFEYKLSEKDIKGILPTIYKLLNYDIIYDIIQNKLKKYGYGKV
ncbi:MAG: hypothetical protein QW757_03730, partial [Candidatus Woesearchaeota archaeon]